MISYAEAKKGVNYGSATAGLALGLDGITNEQLQEMTNKYYENYLAKLEAAGFEIMSAEEVKKNENFAKYEMYEGGTPVMNQGAKGYLSTSPANFTSLVGGTAFGNVGGSIESNNLGGIIIARVSLVVPFAESQAINGGLVGGVAKITAKADLRISPSESIPVEGDFKKPINLLSDITFSYKESLKWQGFSQGKLKKPFEIEEVLDEDTKYKSTSVATSGSEFSTRYSEAYAENAVLIPCDPTKYEKGVNEAITTYINATLDEFLGYYK
jgi:hypothetical protein